MKRGVRGNGGGCEDDVTPLDSREQDEIVEKMQADAAKMNAAWRMGLGRGFVGATVVFLLLFVHSLVHPRELYHEGRLTDEGGLHAAVFPLFYLVTSLTSAAAASHVRGVGQQSPWLGGCEKPIAITVSVVSALFWALVLHRISAPTGGAGGADDSSSSSLSALAALLLRFGYLPALNAAMWCTARYADGEMASLVAGADELDDLKYEFKKL
jgi:hypothetical protein